MSRNNCVDRLERTAINRREEQKQSMDCICPFDPLHKIRGIFKQKKQQQNSGTVKCEHSFMFVNREFFRVVASNVGFLVFLFVYFPRYT